MKDLKAVVKDSGVGISELAEIIGVSRQTIHYYITQGSKNSIDTLYKISKAIGCDITELFDKPNNEVEESTITCPHCGKDIKLKVE
ncbi:MAG: helix-turn-helix transcriptional regulator [Tannerella sp.]|jgi:transcriptional regulator with XRE-family HTH domain|nr:helix-turn-helix transcriptional regulator [Tannerella sp.]